eukprot:2603917-Pleurochrysis_carterae.AAC.4
MSFYAGHLDSQFKDYADQRLWEYQNVDGMASNGEGGASPVAPRLAAKHRRTHPRYVTCREKRGGRAADQARGAAGIHELVPATQRRAAARTLVAGRRDRCWRGQPTPSVV